MGCSGSNVRKTKQVIFVIGGPFSGKEVLCPKIQSAFGWTHLDLEDLIAAAKEQNVQTVKTRHAFFSRMPTGARTAACRTGSNRRNAKKERTHKRPFFFLFPLFPGTHFSSESLLPSKV